MRNHNKDIKINKLIEKNAKKKFKGQHGFEKYVAGLIELEQQEKEMKRIHNNQLKKEVNGRFVNVQRGLQIFIKNGDDEASKIQKFLKRLKESEEKYC